MKKTKSEWVGVGLSAMVLIALAVFSVVKFVQPGDYAENAAAMGMQSHHILTLGVLLAICAITYGIPRLQLVGAILITGYFGGAICVHFLADDPLGNLVLPIVLPVFAWLGLYLRSAKFRAAF